LRAVVRQRTRLALKERTETSGTPCSVLRCIPKEKGKSLLCVPLRSLCDLCVKFLAVCPTVNSLLLCVLSAPQPCDAPGDTFVTPSVTP
jgi:hypothetical protein